MAFHSVRTFSSRAGWTRRARGFGEQRPGPLDLGWAFQGCPHRADRDGAAFPVPVLGDAVPVGGGYDQFRRERRGEVVRGEGGVAPFDAAGIRVERGVQRAFGGREVAQDPIQGLGGDDEIVAPAAVLPGMEVGPGEEGLVGQHLLEVRHQPAGVGRVPAEAAHDVVVDAARGHGVESAVGHVACGAPLLRRPGRARRPEAQLHESRTGELGCGTEAAPLGVEARAQAFDHGGNAGSGIDVGAGCGIRVGAHTFRPEDGREVELSLYRCDEGIGLFEDLVALAEPGLSQRLHDTAERGQAVSFHRREIGACVEGSAVRCAEDGHGPAARSRQGLCGRHVHRVEVGPLLPVDLHRDEPAGEVGRRLGILETFVGHDVTPVARGIADGQEDGLVLVLGPAQGLVTPWKPLHRIVGVLAEIGARLVGQAVHQRRC